MTYVFYCNCCKEEHEREIAIKDYDKEKTAQVCPDCGNPMRRLLQWTGPATINGGYEEVAGRAKWQ